MKMLLVLLPQECHVQQDRTGLDTGDLATALAEADTEVERLSERLGALRDEAWDHSREADRWQDQFKSMLLEMERLGSAPILNKLERLMIQRFLQPVDMWMENPYVAKFPFPRPQDGEWWYVLVIEPPDLTKSERLWIKFAVDAKADGGQDYYGIMQNDSCIQHAYKHWRRESLVNVLERHFVLHMDQPEYAPTISHGSAHLYRMPGRDSEIEKLRKEDRIY